MTLKQLCYKGVQINFPTYLFLPLVTGNIILNLFTNII